MSRAGLLALAGLVLLLTAGAARAEEGILVVHVTYLDQKPLARVRIGTAGDGSIADSSAQVRQDEPIWLELSIAAANSLVSSAAGISL